MSLNVQPWYFASSVSNLSDPPSSVPGVTFTAGANNVDSAPVLVLSALPFDACYLIIGFSGIGANGIIAHALADLLIDRAGGSSWSDFVDNLCCGMTTVMSNSSGIATSYHLPLWIPAGASLGLRAKTAHIADFASAKCVIWAFGNPSRPEMWWCGQKVETLGANDTVSKGTDVNSGNAVWGEWTNIGNPTGARYGALQHGVNGPNGGTVSAYHWQIGYGSNPLPGFSVRESGVNSAETGSVLGQFPVWCDVPSGTQLQARLMASAAPDPHNTILYGVY